MNILFLNDPSCVHGFKWMKYFSNQTEKYTCFVIGQQHQDKRLEDKIKHKLIANNIQYLAPVFEFSVSNFIRTSKDFRYLKQIIVENKIDIIHIMYAEPNVMWGLGKSYFGIPMILTTRGTDVLVTIPSITKQKHPFNQLLKVLFRDAFQNMDFISSTSSKQQKAVIEILNGKKVPTEVIRTGIYIDDVLKPSTTEIDNQLQNKPFIFFPRYMNTLYNHDFSLDAIAMLPKEIVEKYKMVFVDGNGKAVGYIEDIRKRMNSIKDANFVFLNELSQNELFDLYKKSSLVIMNPLSDGSPVSALESMCVGKPVILGPLDYDKDLFENTTFQLKKWDAKELADLIVYILDEQNIEKIRLLTEKAKVVVAEKADTIKEVRKIEGIYHKLVQKQ